MSPVDDFVTGPSSPPDDFVSGRSSPPDLSRFRREVEVYDLRCTCESCGAFDAERNSCAYGFPTEPHRRLPLAGEREFIFCKAFELT